MVARVSFALFMLSGGAMTVAHAQEEPFAQDTTVFRSIERALLDPEHVFRLDLSGKHLGTFPAEVLRFTNLRELRLRDDDLTVIPDAIGELKHLRLLDLSGNPITLLPPRFADLTELEELFLNEDKVLDLEADIATLALLPRLRILHLERDGLGSLPANMSKLQALEELYLNGNRFVDVPPPLLLMPKLRMVDMHENPIDPLKPMDLQQRGVLVRF